MKAVSILPACFTTWLSACDTIYLLEFSEDRIPIHGQRLLQGIGQPTYTINHLSMHWILALDLGPEMDKAFGSDY